MINIYRFYIESKKYPNGIEINEPSTSRELAEEGIRKDFENIDDEITYIEFNGIKE